MKISSYEDLLNAANAQPHPQRRLFVFTEAELPGDHTREQQEHFHQGRGGALTPVMCVDKLASERATFAGLVEESRQTGKNWDIVFVACMDVLPGHAAGAANEAEQPLKSMIRSIREGSIAKFLAFNREGELVSLVAS